MTIEAPRYVLYWKAGSIPSHTKLRNEYQAAIVILSRAKNLRTNGASSKGQITCEYPHGEVKMTHFMALSPHFAADA